MITKLFTSIFIWITIGIFSIAMAQSRTKIEYTGQTPEGLVGNGKSVVKVQPSEFSFHSGGSAKGKFHLIIDGKIHEIKSDDSHSTFFPGGVEYTVLMNGIEVNILHGALPEVEYILALHIKNAKGKIELEIESEGEPKVKPVGRIPFNLKNGEGEIFISTGALNPSTTFSQLRKQFEEPYQKGFLLETPSILLDRAVPFNRYLLDLGFDSNLHVCEIFRWRDVWSRDLGSGLAPGSMVSGEFSQARTTIEYDLNRYAKANPTGLKVTEDPSQGGSAEGTAWLTRAVWRYFLLTGDKKFLINAEKILKPWVDAWIDRDANEQGLLIDVTEWMDHSRFFLFPDGARILYSNVLFVDLLNTFSKIEKYLGSTNSASNYEIVRDRFIRAINSKLWNESAGEYNNLLLWDLPDERSSSAENALAILCGVAPQNRIERILNTVREKNWRDAGSTTIFPPMTHVDTTIDHNYKVWPWWNAVEARARFLNGDIEGGIYLLEKCSATLEDIHYPGLIEELVTPYGKTEGGNAFLTAAGSYLDAVFEGLLGIQILEPGCTRIRVSPNTPAEWKNWNATVPLPEGELSLVQTDGKLHIKVTDPRVKIIEAPNSAIVEGAEHSSLSEIERITIDDLSAPKPKEVPPLHTRKAALFFDKNLTSTISNQFDKSKDLFERTISIEELPNLNNADIDALVIGGNALPGKTKGGVDIQPVLSDFLNRGGAIVFFGATMRDRGTMGETGGVIDWYEYRPLIKFNQITGWKLKASQSKINAARDDEYGLLNNWIKKDFDDSGWKDADVPKTWEEFLGPSYDGWGWYRAHFNLPADAEGKSILIEPGRIDDEDCTYVNGVLIGSEKGWQTKRRYYLKPTDSIYASLNFGGDNVIAIQVFDGGGTGGLFIDKSQIGIATNDFGWQPVDPRTGVTLSEPVRHGVVSWGPGGNFFNSWETSRGAFGFKVEGSGVQFVNSLSGLPDLDVNVNEAFTDFAVTKPWIFEPLAFTKTNRKLLIPDNGERYPCSARIVNTKTKGEFILIPASITKTSNAKEIFNKLLIEVKGSK